MQHSCLHTIKLLATYETAYRQERVPNATTRGSKGTCKLPPMVNCPAYCAPRYTTLDSASCVISQAKPFTQRPNGRGRTSTLCIVHCACSIKGPSVFSIIRLGRGICSLIGLESIHLIRYPKDSNYGPFSACQEKQAPLVYITTNSLTSGIGHHRRRVLGLRAHFDSILGKRNEEAYPIRPSQWRGI